MGRPRSVGGGSDDLFTQQRSAAALDQPELGIDLVGAVDRQIEFRNFVQRSKRNAERLRLRFRRLRRRDTMHVETRFDSFAHEIDEEARGRPAAEPELHPRPDQLQRPLGRLALSLVPVRRRGHCAHSLLFVRTGRRARTSGDSRFTG